MVGLIYFDLYAYPLSTEAKATAGKSGIQSDDGGELDGTKEHAYGCLMGPSFTDNIDSQWLTNFDVILMATPIPPQR
jgi:hypothetical protein